MPRATVPKTAVHKNGESFASEYEIRFSWKHLVSSPARDAVRSKNCNQHEFCVLVSGGLDCSHHPRAFSFAENVCHIIYAGSDWRFGQFSFLALFFWR